MSFNRNAQEVRTHPSVQKGGCYEVHDIEDLIKVGEMVGGLVSYLNNFYFTQARLFSSK